MMLAWLVAEFCGKHKKEETEENNGSG